jgi:predicted Fe-S protein YdhL (DUF1289 family)
MREGAGCMPRRCNRVEELHNWIMNEKAKRNEVLREMVSGAKLRSRSRRTEKHPVETKREAGS